MEDEEEGLKERITEIINKVYIEQNREKVYSLLFDLCLLCKESPKEAKGIILYEGEGYVKQHDKVGDIVIKDKGYFEFRIQAMKEFKNGKNKSKN